MTDFIFAYITIFQLLFSETAHDLPGATGIEDLDMPSGHSPDPTQARQAPDGRCTPARLPEDKGWYTDIPYLHQDTGTLQDKKTSVFLYSTSQQ